MRKHVIRTTKLRTCGIQCSSFPMNFTEWCNTRWSEEYSRGLQFAMYIWLRRKIAHSFVLYILYERQVEGHLYAELCKCAQCLYKDDKTKP